MEKSFNFISIFLLWTFVLYWIHRAVHKIPMLRSWHWDHHKYINLNHTKWHWNNLLLFNDTYKSTADLWITEVIPTVIFSWITGHWWILIFYYLWASLLQERIEHNKNFSIYPWLTSGKWHLLHHVNSKVNFGLFWPIWDICFKTRQCLRK
jgi:sterol desaturase/sphingolipid hydroxylase (fatty acid hydroxylase superfamily)